MKLRNTFFPLKCTVPFPQAYSAARLVLMALLTSLTAVATPPSGYYQVWSDEFDGSALNGGKWGTFTGTAWFIVT